MEEIENHYGCRRLDKSTFIGHSIQGQLSTFFSNAQEHQNFYKINNILGHKTSLNKLESTDPSHIL